MKTDSLLYALFQTAPGLLFELLGQSADLADNYEFRSIEVKQVAFRIDGVFLPKPGAVDQTVIFLENQFQNDPLFYHRFFAEIFNLSNGLDSPLLAAHRPTASEGCC